MDWPDNSSCCVVDEEPKHDSSVKDRIESQLAEEYFFGLLKKIINDHSHRWLVFDSGWISINDINKHLACLKACE